MAAFCPNCGNPADRQDKYCRQCGSALASRAEFPLGARSLTSEDAANLWKNFFRPFFKVAFIFFACFFGFALLLTIFWYFKFAN